MSRKVGSPVGRLLPQGVDPTRNTTNEEYVVNNFRLLIKGRLDEGAGTLDVINPATGRALTTSPRAGNPALGPS